ncbi:MAG: CoA transferase, partial [Clostridia bacterium]
ARVKNVDLVDAIVGEWTAKQLTSDIVSMLEKAGVPCAPVLSIDQVVQDPHVQAREMVVKVEYPGIPPVYLSGTCPKLSLTPATVDAPPPTLGQHNEEVYCGLLGLDRSELEELKAQGVI